jgi:hypothetical protein
MCRGNGLRRPGGTLGPAAAFGAAGPSYASSGAHHIGGRMDRLGISAIAGLAISMTVLVYVLMTIQ